MNVTPTTVEIEAQISVLADRTYWLKQNDKPHWYLAVSNRHGDKTFLELRRTAAHPAGS